MYSLFPSNETHHKHAEMNWLAIVSEQQHRIILRTYVLRLFAITNLHTEVEFSCFKQNKYFVYLLLFLTLLSEIFLSPRSS